MQLGRFKGRIDSLQLGHKHCITEVNLVFPRNIVGRNVLTKIPQQKVLLGFERVDKL